nr:unnamed protein product [Haemonchus contortus]
MEDPIGRLLHVLATDTRSEQYSHYGIGNSKYKQALMEVFLERKETIRTRLDPTVYDFKARRLLVRANSMLDSANIMTSLAMHANVRSICRRPIIHDGVIRRNVG